MCADLDLPTVEVKLLTPFGRIAVDDDGESIGTGFVPARLLRRRLRSDFLTPSRPTGFVDFLLLGKNRVTVETRISERPAGSAGVVEDIEPKLVVVASNAGPPADDLLEFR